MIFHFEDLNQSTSSLQPETCLNCGWWQGHDRGWPSPAAAASWNSSAARNCGRWGKMARGDDRLLGLIQFGPSSLFPRAKKMPGGPATPGAVLLACSMVAETGLTAVRKSLVLVMLDELEQGGCQRVEAWGRESATSDGECRLFEREFLAGCGFSPVRHSQGLVLMGLELKTLQRVRPLPQRRRLLERLRRGAPAPSPSLLVSSKSGSERALVRP